jgi:hypothetical protein
MTTTPVGTAGGCDLLILIFAKANTAEDQQQKIAGFASSYIDRVHPPFHERTQSP